MKNARNTVLGGVGSHLRARKVFGEALRMRILGGGGRAWIVAHKKQT